MLTPRSTGNSFTIVIVFAALAGLFGCGSGDTNGVSSPVPPPYTPPTGSFTGVSFSGQVSAGASPVQGASVQLYSAGTTGNASAPVQLLSGAMTTDASGAFSVSAPYTCASSTSLLFLVSTGGHVGSSAANAGTVLVGSPGTCNNVTSTSKYILNEATTVAGAYAFAQFLGTGAQLGATATNSSGLTLAAGTMAKLVDPSSGSIVPANAAAAGRIASIANALHACISSSGSGSAECNGLYAAAAANGRTPANTLDAALSVALNPANNVAALYSLSSGTGTAFAGGLSQAPTDWTLFISYKGAGLNEPTSVSIDSGGRVWVANYGSVASLFTNRGDAVFPQGITGNNLRQSFGGAVDAGDNFWVANQQTPGSINSGFGNITVFNPSGQAISGATGYAAGGLNYPTSVSFDGAGTAWIADYGNSHVTLLSSSGSPLSGSAGYTDASITFPDAVAVDSKRNGYVANQSSNLLVKVAADGSSFTKFVTGQGGSAVAIDAADNAWVSNYYDDSVGLVSAGGKILSGAGFIGGGLAHPVGIAVDGSGKAWVANYRGSSISELAAASAMQPGQLLSPSAGWGPDAALLEAYGLAIDASGNIWVSSFGNDSLTEYIGLAAPVKTPLLGPVRTP